MIFDFTHIIVFIVFLGCLTTIFYIILKQGNNYLLERLRKGHAVKKQRGIFDDLLKLVKPLTIINMRSSKNKTGDLFIRLGMPASETDIMEFENRRTLRLFITLTVGLIVTLILFAFVNDSSMKLIILVSCLIFPSYIVYLKPIWQLNKRIKQKEKAFEKFFADAIDLLCVCVEAGLSIDSAIERVGREFSYFSQEVGGEFNRIAKDILSGVSKQDALMGLSERIRNRDIQTFIAIIVQADKMGASVASSLSISADSLRTKRKQRLEAQVSSASTKMTFPLVLFLLPAIFAVVLTPAIIQVVESLGQVNGFK